MFNLENDLIIINKYIENKEYDKAIDEIDYLLSLNCLPTKQIEQLEQLKKEIIICQNENNFNSIQTSSKNLLWNKIYNEHRFDISLFEFLLNQQNNNIDDEDLNQLDLIFIDKKISNDIKVYLFETLKKINVNYEFTVYNNFLNTKFLVNPLDTIEYFNQFNYLLNQLNQHYFKDPSKEKFAILELKMIFNLYFPTKVKFDDNDIINSIINVVENLFDPSIKLINNEIVKLLVELNNNAQK